MTLETNLARSHPGTLHETMTAYDLPTLRPGERYPAWLPIALLAENDTEESVMGTHIHQHAIIQAYGTLRDYAASPGMGTRTDPAWYVSTQETVIYDIPLRPDAWQPKPDVWVVTGLRLAMNSAASYDTRTGTAQPLPDFLLEMLSESTRANDLATKRVMYELAGAQEYLIFDPTGTYLTAGMRGWRRSATGEWEEWLPVSSEDGTPVWESGVLGLALRPEGMVVRFDHPTRGRLRLWSEAQDMLAELQRQLEAKHHQADLERQRAEAERQHVAERDATIVALEAELRRLRGE